MKNKVVILFMLVLVAFACKNEKETQNTIEETEEVTQVSDDLAYASFGDEIDADGAITASEMAERYTVLKVGDTLTTKVTATINEVCSKKGCWMKLDLGDEKDVMVRFKDYGFFMPLNAEGEVIVNGKAYVTETSVEELRHYAEDAGKSAEEVAAITEVEKTFAFEADGVLLKQ